MVFNHGTLSSLKHLCPFSKKYRRQNGTQKQTGVTFAERESFLEPDKYIVLIFTRFIIHKKTQNYNDISIIFIYAF